MADLNSAKKANTKSSEVEMVNLDYLRNQRFLLGDIYVKSKFSDKRFLLFRAGEFLTDFQLETLEEKGHKEFIYIEVIIKEIYLPWVNVLKDISSCIENPEKEKEIKTRLTKFYREHVASGVINRNECHGIIYAHLKVLSEKKGMVVVNEFAQKSLDLFKRQVIVGSLSIVPLFLMGHEDVPFLVDVFHSVLLCSSSIWGDYSSILADGLKVIHDSPLKPSLTEKTPHYEKVREEVADLPTSSFEKVQIDQLYNFDYESCAYLVERHMEWCHGDKNLFNSELVNDWMAIIFVFDLIVPFELPDQLDIKERIMQFNEEQKIVINKLSKVAYFLDDCLAFPLMQECAANKKESA